MSESCFVVLSTCPDVDSATRLAHLLVEQHAAACVNIVPAVRSIYRWQGGTQSDEEHLLLIKTTAARYARVEQLIREHHPYELPEVVAVPTVAGSERYLEWVSECLVRKEPEQP